MQILKDRLVVFLFAMLIASTCRAQVYAHGAYSAGTTWFQLCAVTLRDQPHQFKLTEECWLEDSNGLSYIGIGHKQISSDIPRASLEVQRGTNIFRLALDALSISPDPAFPRNVCKDGGLPLTKGVGDLGQMIMQCVTNLGGRTSTNALSDIPAFWVQHSTGIGDFFVVKGDHFTEVQHYLEQVFRQQDATIDSSSTQPNGHSITYTPAKAGVTLNLTSGLDLTVISILGN